MYQKAVKVRDFLPQNSPFSFLTMNKSIYGILYLGDVRKGKEDDC
jgi:hypothetical protein